MALIGGFMLVEVVGGLLANSLALLADAAHMVTDAAAIGLALFAMWFASRQASFSRTFGFYRTEVIAALLNALSMWLVAGWIFFEAYGRIYEPPEINAVPVLVVGSVGLLVNAAAAWVLKRSSTESLNVEGAFLHVLGDLLGSVGVIISGLLIITMGWQIADPIIGFTIGLLVLLSSGRLLWKTLHVLMQGTPPYLDLDRLCMRMEQVEHVTGVHDIHAWTVTTGYDVLSAHVTANTVEEIRPHGLLKTLREIVASEFGISHVTIQLEEESVDCEERHHIAHVYESEHDPASREPTRPRQP